MGDHYVPRHHLRRFSSNAEKDLVWMYDKQQKTFREAGIARVAQQSDYYDDEIEKELSRVIEGPGNIIVGKLINREDLDNSERTLLSLYLLIMATRGPRQRRKAFAIAPESLKRVAEENHRTLESLRDILPKTDELIEKFDAVHMKFSNEIPKGIVDLIRTPFWTERTVECVHNMFWHIIPAAPGHHFVTCDTPCHYFEAYGVGTQSSELTFTISKDLALIGEHQHSWGIAYEKPDSQILKEINRRILNHCERFAFSPKKDVWIESVVQRRPESLNRIEWN